ncbi:MAG: alanine glycine permease, partial [Flavobacteriaceae bacterium]|nr:alanine glycine permease [Flavobacteriaceae bacterium]
MKKYLLSFLTVLTPLLTFAQDVEEVGIDQQIDQAFKPISDFFSSVIFFEVAPDTPFVIVLLVGSAAFFTIYFGFPNIRFFGKAVNTVRGKYEDIEKYGAKELYGEGGIAQGTDMTKVDSLDKHLETVDELAVDGDIVDTIRDESSDGEVSHFQALATAVSGTVGNGNIAGVALAIALGGPGATFWMIVCGLLGMSTKFVECTLGVQYRDVGPDGTVYGGPMYYLSKGLKERGFAWLGKIAAVLFAIFCIGGSFGGGNAAQSNQATIVIKEMFDWESTLAGTIVGVVLAILVGIIIIGGIKRIAKVTEKVVP